MKTRFEELLDERSVLEKLTADNIIAMNRVARLDQDLAQRATRIKKRVQESLKAMRMDKGQGQTSSFSLAAE